MAERKAVYFIVPEGYDVPAALGFNQVVAGPCDSKSEAMKVAASKKDVLNGRFDMVKAHFQTVGTFAVAPVTTTAFLHF